MFTAVAALSSGSFSLSCQVSAKIPNTSTYKSLAVMCVSLFLV